MIHITLDCEEIIEKKVTKQGDCGRIYLHRRHIGKKVKIIIPVAGKGA